MRASRVTVPVLAAMSLAMGGCSRAGRWQTPCVADGCGASPPCVAGRCRPSGNVPAFGDAARVVLLPASFAVLSAHGGGGGPSLPDTFALGRGADGRVVVLLRFEPSFRQGAIVVSAFVVLDPLDGAPPTTSTTRIDVARVLEPWEPSTVTWGRQPRLSVPTLAAYGSPRPQASLHAALSVPRLGGQALASAAVDALAAARAPLRVDVTDLVRAWWRRRGDDHGLALSAKGDDAVGALYTTGATRGRPPRLEVYLK